MDLKTLAQKIKQSDRFVSGHRSCAGCPFPGIVRVVLAAADDEVVVSCATSCLEVVSTIYPFTSWKVPWIHNTFENAAATISGVEAAYQGLKRKKKINRRVKFIAFGGDGGCYSDDTEIFTEEGFISVKNMKVGKKVWSVSPKTNQLELAKIDKVHKYRYNGNLIRAKTRFIDFLVTPNHNVPMWYKGEWKFIKAEELITRYKTTFLRNFDWQGKKQDTFILPKIKRYRYQKEFDKFPMRKWLRFLGWYLSEGTLYKSKSGYLVRIYQSNKQNRKVILSLIQSLGLLPFECSRSVDFQSKQVYEFLEKECGKGSKNKKIPKWVLELDKEYLREIYETLMAGDGSISTQKDRKNPHQRFITSSKFLMNSFVELVFKMGMNCSVRKRKDDGIYTVGIDEIYLKHKLYSRRRIYEETGVKQVTQENYNGYVYCPQLDRNHTVIVKRNNKICLSGNSYDIGLQSLSGALERGHDFVYVCYDNEGYQNTGGQRSSATPYGAATTTSPDGKFHHGKEQFRKDLIKIAVAHNIPYAAQAACHNKIDLYNKAKKAIETPGPAVLNVFSPCIPNWKLQMNEALEISELATETCFWPLYEVVEGKYKLNYRPNKKRPITDFLQNQGRFKHLFEPANRGIVMALQAEVDRRWDEVVRLSGN